MATTPSVKSEYYLDPVTGQRYVMSKPGGTIDPSGNQAGNMLARVHDNAGTVTTRDITIDAVADLFTTPSAPIAAELITIDSIPAGTKICNIWWIAQELPYVQSATSDVHIAAFVVGTLNAEDNGTALARLSLANNGVGTHSVDTRKRMLDSSRGVISWDLTDTDETINRIDLGAIPPTDTGQIPVYLSVEFVSYA